MRTPALGRCPTTGDMKKRTLVVGVAVGLALSVVPMVSWGYFRDWAGGDDWWSRPGAVVVVRGELHRSRATVERQ